jgi:hypothetical protein
MEDKWNPSIINKTNCLVKRVTKQGNFYEVKIAMANGTAMMGLMRNPRMFNKSEAVFVIDPVNPRAIIKSEVPETSLQVSND